MGNSSYGDGSITIYPSIVVHPESRFHPGNRNSDSLVRLVVDENFLSTELKPWGMDGMGKWLGEQFLDDIDEFVRGCQDHELGGFLDYYDEYDQWRATPLRTRKGNNRTYRTHLMGERWPEGPEEIKLHGTKVKKPKG